MALHIEQTIQRVTGQRPISSAPMGGGCVANVRRFTLANGGSVVAKSGAPGSNLSLEGAMLRYLAAYGAVPVPTVLHAEDTLLLMSHVETDGGIDGAAEADAGTLLATLHDRSADAFGFDHDTVIGGLRQPNPWTPSWLDFFREQRLLFMAREGLDAGRLPAPLMGRIEALAGRLDRWLEEPERPSLVHGDMWTGNVLCRNGRIAAFIDPAIYYADAEIELAFSTLFGTFGTPFFESYQRRRPLRPGFFERRRDLYNLYPLLVHVRLFGGHYVSSVEAIVRRFGV